MPFHPVRRRLRNAPRGRLDPFQALSEGRRHRALRPHPLPRLLRRPPDDHRQLPFERPFVKLPVDNAPGLLHGVHRRLVPEIGAAFYRDIRQISHLLRQGLVIGPEQPLNVLLGQVSGRTLEKLLYEPRNAFGVMLAYQPRQPLLPATEALTLDTGHQDLIGQVCYGQGQLRVVGDELLSLGAG